MKRIVCVSSLKGFILITYQLSICCLLAAISCQSLSQSLVPADELLTDAGTLHEIELEVVSSTEGRMNVLFYNDDEVGMLDTFSTIDDVSAPSAIFACTAGAKKVVVIAGGKDESLIKAGTYSEFVSRRVSLEQDNEKEPILSGEARIGASETSAAVELHPLRSSVRVNSIESSLEIENAEWYLTNVNSAVPYLHGEHSRPNDMKPRSTMHRIGTISDMPVYPEGEEFCYRHTEPDEVNGPTRLVIKGEINDTSFFWPIRVSPEEASEYIYNIHITRKGTLSEEDEAWSGQPYARIFPGQIVPASVGDDVYVSCICNPDWTSVTIDKDDLDYDVQRGIYTYELDRDGKGVTLHLTGRGTGMFIIEAGYPVNKGYLILVYCE